MKRPISIASTLLLLAACGSDNNANSTNGMTNNMSNNNAMNMNNIAPNNMNNIAPNNMNNVVANSSNNNTIVDCGAVTFDGECSDATTLLFCDDEFGLLEIPCDDPDNLGASATCLDIPDYGADCALPAGGSCELYDEEADELFYIFCDGTDPGCVWNADEDVVCVDNFGTCDEDTFAESCDGDTYHWGCNVTQPLAIDCAALGGTCDAAMGCIGIMAGGVCDDTYVFCDAALACSDEGACE